MVDHQSLSGSFIILQILSSTSMKNRPWRSCGWSPVLCQHTDFTDSSHFQIMAQSGRLILHRCYKERNRCERTKFTVHYSSDRRLRSRRQNRGRESQPEVLSDDQYITNLSKVITVAIVPKCRAQGMLGVPTQTRRRPIGHQR